MLKMFNESADSPKKSCGTGCCSETSCGTGKASKPAALQAKTTSRFDTGGNKIHFVSLGCPRNLVDSEVMLGILLKAGYDAVPELTEADFIVINTCGFLEASRKESSDTIINAIATKKQGAKVIATGCMVQKHSDELQKKIPNIDYLLGSGDLEGILTAVESTQSGQIITTARSYIEAGDVPRKVSTPPHYAYLKISEGCRKRCAYCIIPAIKGPLKSKTKEQILKEFHRLLDMGTHEIILIAQDLGDYGKDFGSKKQAALIDLLKSMLETKKDFWLRLLYLYPDEINDEMIELMKSDDRICRYLDMPIQHVNDDILKSMRRATSRADIISTIEKLRKEMPDIVIRTSLIVGFPGETEEQFKELMTFVQKYPLDNIGIFKFSREPGSTAYNLPDQIPEDVKEDRYHRLMKLQKKTVAKLNKKWIGKTIPVMLEGYHPETKLLMRGRSHGQCPEIDGQILINDGRHATAFGKVHMVEITEVADYDLVGKVLPKKK